MQTGLIENAISGQNFTVTFEKPFDEPPKIFLTVKNNTGGQFSRTVNVCTVNTTGFTGWYGSASGEMSDIYWVVLS